MTADKQIPYKYIFALTVCIVQQILIAQYGIPHTIKNAAVIQLIRLSKRTFVYKPAFFYYAPASIVYMKMTYTYGAYTQIFKQMI